MLSACEAGTGCLGIGAPFSPALLSALQFFQFFALDQQKVRCGHIVYTQIQFVARGSRLHDFMGPLFGPTRLQFLQKIPAWNHISCFYTVYYLIVNHEYGLSVFAYHRHRFGWGVHRCCS